MFISCQHDFPITLFGFLPLSRSLSGGCILSILCAPKFWQVSAQPGPVITLQSLCSKVAVSSCCVASSFLDYYQKVSSTVAEHKAMYHHRQGLIFCTSICFTIAVADPRHATSCAQGRASCHSEVNYCHSFSSYHICIISR